MSFMFVAWLAFASAPIDAKPIRVGSKSFTESVLLGEIITGALTSTGATAEHRKQLGGTRVLWSALESGQIDIYPDYTGTISQEILGGHVPANLTALRTALREKHLRLSDPLGFDNTYALGMTRAKATELKLHRISELKAQPSLRFGVSNEFLDRGDGWRALSTRYGLTGAAVTGIDHDLCYRALGTGGIDVTDLYSTDAEIRAFDLAVLEDDLHFFPDYQAVFVYRDDVAERLEPVLSRVAGHIPQATMIALNAEAKISRRDESSVAQGFLAQQGFPTVVAKTQTRTERVLQSTLAHLFLVGVSLFAAILFAVPLGVLAAKRGRLASFVLASTGVLQTIPSLALLVFMIPLLGIGAKPAIAALFLYSLLPIVRNTYAGLTGIPRDLRESASVLGLRPFTRLFRIDLPLATPSILAGIKIAAVINVGTATLGALIGAGGYGQAILTGIRLNRMDLLLEGAIPAAVLALLVERLFDVVERVLVPRGLRL